MSIWIGDLTVRKDKFTIKIKNVFSHIIGMWSNTGIMGKINYTQVNLVILIWRNTCAGRLKTASENFLWGLKDLRCYTFWESLMFCKEQ